MKSDIIGVEGKKEKEIELPDCFSSPIREDIVMRVEESMKKIQPYAPFEMAGKQSSASGKIRHSRRKWRTAYGKGISRVPRKIMWRRGDQFYWIGAEVSSARKGRRAHPPKILSMLKIRKVNKKEMGIALMSAISATANTEYLKRRYSSFKDVKINLPLIIDSRALQLKQKEFKMLLKKILGDLFSVAIIEKSIRSGKGKIRGRRYKRTAGLLLVLGKKENASFQGIDIKKADSLTIDNLAGGALGRLTMYTEQSIEDIRNRFTGKIE